MVRITNPYVALWLCKAVVLPGKRIQGVRGRAAVAKQQVAAPSKFQSHHPAKSRAYPLGGSPRAPRAAKSTISTRRPARSAGYPLRSSNPILAKRSIATLLPQPSALTSPTFAPSCGKTEPKKKAEKKKPAKLPVGWTIENEGGDEYYLHKDTKERSIFPPKQETPAGWSLLMDEEGTEYFYDEETGESAWKTA